MKRNIISRATDSKHLKRFRNLLNNNYYNDNKYEEYLNNDINESTFDESDVQINVRLFTSFSISSTDEEKDTVNINDSAL